jgi:hypothetical protein
MLRKEKKMPDQIQQTYDDVRNHAKDYFGIGDSESETLMKLAKRCSQTAGVPMAGFGAVALSSVGSVAIPLVGSVPGFVAGALSGFIGGTTACMIARRASVEHVKQILEQGNLSENDFKKEVRRLISISHGKSGYYQGET